MCLIDCSSKMIAEHPIECIKILDEDLVSVYYNFSYKLGRREEMPRDDFSHHTCTLGRSLVADAFHSYSMNVLKALDCLGEFVIRKSGFLVVRCIIPQGSLYYEGVHPGKVEGYASNAIVPIEVLRRGPRSLYDVSHR